MRIDSSGATVYLNQPGIYRIEVLRSGGLRVEVWEGLAEAATTAGGVLVQPATAAEVRSGEVTGVEPHLTWGDDFARWVEQRRLGYESESSAVSSTSATAARPAILDNYGTWVYVDATQSWAWQPAVGPRLAALHRGTLVLDLHRLVLDLLRTVGLAALPLRLLVLVRRDSAGSGAGVRSGARPGSAGAGGPGYVSWCPWGYYNSWCWGRYPGWGGGSRRLLSDPIAGQPRPPRGDVIPPRDGVNPGESGSSSDTGPPRPSDNGFGRRLSSGHTGRWRRSAVGVGRSGCRRFHRSGPGRRDGSFRLERGGNG